MNLITTTAAQWREIFQKHLTWALSQPVRNSGTPRWDNGLAIIGIRMNSTTENYVRGKHDFNDYLVLVHGGVVTVFQCTTDPADTNENPLGDAHLLEGCWDAYVRGYHKTQDRRALVQRTNPVVVTRTNSKGQVTKQFDRGYFGINIHNAAGWGKPSAGCTVLMPTGGLMQRDTNYLRFRDILNAAPDVPSRTYCLMNVKQLEAYTGASFYD